MQSVTLNIISATCVIAGLALAVPTTVAAQFQRQGDVHSNYSRATASKTNSGGVGAQLQLVFGSKSSPVNIGTSYGGDYLKTEEGGPSQWSAGVDAVLQPGGGGTVTPYAGGGVSANWSTGNNSQWSGAKLGLEAIGGASFKLGSRSSSPSIKIEERFGYISGQDHSLGTRLGFVFSI